MRINEKILNLNDRLRKDTYKKTMEYTKKSCTPERLLLGSKCNKIIGSLIILFSLIFRSNFTIYSILSGAIVILVGLFQSNYAKSKL